MTAAKPICVKTLHRQSLQTNVAIVGLINASMVRNR
jgi:hypothetical protein